MIWASIRARIGGNEKTEGRYQNTTQRNRGLSHIAGPAAEPPEQNSGSGLGGVRRGDLVSGGRSCDQPAGWPCG